MWTLLGEVLMAGLYQEELFGYDAARARMRLPHAYDVAAVTLATAIDCSGDVELVQQHFADEVDINTIVRRFGLTAPQVEGGVYGDFTGIYDFASAREAIARAERDFMALPAEVRERFDNDPGFFFDSVLMMSEDEVDGLMPVVEPEPAPAPVDAPAGG